MAAALSAICATTAQAENIKLRIASGHPNANTYVNLMQNFFVPEVTKRVAEKTQHKVEFVEGYGGSMVKVADTLEGVQSGIIDIGGYCFCFEPSNLPLHAFQVMLPFGTMSPEKSVKLARTVYNKVPYMSQVFEDKFNQKLLSLIADNGYNLGTTFEWNNVGDLKGKKIAGAGLNLKWLEYAGAVPVQSSLPEAYTSMQTGVYFGWIMFPSGWVNFKLNEVAKNYTEVGFGSISWHGLTINKNKFNRLPKEVQDIILEVGKEYEAKTGSVNEENYPKQLVQLKSLGVNVKSVPDSVRTEWANSLKEWPQIQAQDLDKQGLPATLVLKTTLEEAEKIGHKWPVRYSIK
jgi:TRAP-type C4-dicarboxylate transport system substrate-binding protein